MSNIKSRSKVNTQTHAGREQCRARKKERIKSAAGKMEFTISAEQLRHGDGSLLDIGGSVPLSAPERAVAFKKVRDEVRKRVAKNIAEIR